MQHLVNLQALHQPLIDAELVPPECRLMRIDIGVSGAFVVTYEVFFTAEQVAKLGRVLQEVGGDAGA